MIQYIAMNNQKRQEQQKAADKRYYQKHKEEKRAYSQRYYEEHREKLLLQRRKDYQEHPEIKEYQTNWRRTHKEQVKEALAKCYQKHAEKRRQYAFEHRQKNIVAIIEKERQVKRDTLIHYGNGKLACVKCGFEDIRALSIDHINGGGAAHKRYINNINLYRWLKKQGYPMGYQTLCMNCQFIKERTIVISVL